jgi:hypothetical protein
VSFYGIASNRPRTVIIVGDASRTEIDGLKCGILHEHLSCEEWCTSQPLFSLLDIDLISKAEEISHPTSPNLLGEQQPCRAGNLLIS